MSSSSPPTVSAVDRLRTLPRGVWALGCASLFMDMSSELIHSLLPVFLVSVLGVSAMTVGVVEGIAEATASITRIFSGVISDWIRRRKPLVLLGYTLAALTKPLFPLANGVSLVLTARFIDRVAKGIRGAPRDALVADLTPPSLLGAAYGLRQSMDTVGAVAGPLLAMLLMLATAGDFRLVFWFAVIPAAICVAIIAFGVREPRPTQEAEPDRNPIQRVEVARLPRRYWWVVAFASVLTLARFSEAFILLRAEDLGLALTWVPLILLVMNVAYAASAYPFGHLSDRLPRRSLLALGILFLIAADLVLALAGVAWGVAAGALLWGLHLGATQGLLSALIAGSAPADLRGTAFGIFNLAVGVALLLASLIAGALWTAVGPSMTFYTGAAISAVALAGLLVKR